MIGLATDAALGQARSLLGSAAAPTVAGADDPLALAWALKALCYEAWSTEPPRALRYLEALAGPASARSRYQALAVPHCLAIAEKQLADAYLVLRLLPEAQA